MEKQTTQQSDVADEIDKELCRLSGSAELARLHNLHKILDQARIVARQSMTAQQRALTPM